MKRNKTMSENSRPTRFKDLVPRWQEQSENFKKKFLRGVVHAFAWTGMAVLYYLAFSIFFDTPLEYEMKHSTRMLRQQYDSLSRRYDTIEKVLMNVIDRDRSVFRTLFESDPYNFDTDFEKKKWEAQEKLLTKSNKELGKLFLEKLRSFEKRGSEQLFTLATLEQAADSLKDRFDNIPAIQPVINKELTLLTASYGMRIHPFYKSLAAQRRFARIRHRRRTHQGDYHQAHLFGQHGGHRPRKRIRNRIQPLRQNLRAPGRPRPSGRHHRPVGQHGPVARSAPAL